MNRNLVLIIDLDRQSTALNRQRSLNEFIKSRDYKEDCNSFLYSPSERIIQAIYNCEVTMERIQTIITLTTTPSTTDSVTDLANVVNILLNTIVYPTCTPEEVTSLTTLSASVEVRIRITTHVCFLQLFCFKASFRKRLSTFKK